jgi:hypothetical protein
MLGCCIRSEPRLENDEYTTSTTLEKTGRPFIPKKTNNAVITPAYMIDLEAGLNIPTFVVYEPRVKPPFVWTHGARLSI